MKKCVKCKIEKPLDCYTKAKRQRSGLSGRCKTCKNEYGAKWREENREYSSLYMKKYRNHMNS